MSVADPGAAGASAVGPAPAEPPEPAPPAIATFELTKRFGSVPALTGLSLHVGSGEIFGYLGPNGAGKSTTIRLLLGLLHPTTGSANVLGLDTERHSVEIRRRLGYLPGGIAFDDTLTGLRALDQLGELQGCAPVLRDELCEALQLSGETLRRRVRDYSRGMRQKLGIVQALQHDPALVILDEPTEGLDPLMQLAFYGILEQLRARHRTIFFSSHVLSEVERVCDRVAIIRAGRLMTVETVRALLSRRRRHVQLRVDGSVPDLDGIPGVSRVVKRGAIVTCQLQGDIRQFLGVVATLSVEDLLIEPARLEDVFLEYYDADTAEAAP